LNVVETLILCTTIAANNLVVSVGLGAMGRYNYWKRIVVVFGLTEFSIPLIGLLLGKFLRSILMDSAQAISASVLVALGVFFIWNAYQKRNDLKKIADQISEWKSLLLLALGLSLDNLAVGIGLGLGESNPLLIASLIGSLSMIFSYLGLQLGKAGISINEKMTGLLTGLILIGIGAVQLYRLFAPNM